LEQGHVLWREETSLSVAADVANAIAAAVEAAAAAHAGRSALGTGGAEDRTGAERGEAETPAPAGARLPVNEARRLEALRSYGILDTPPEAELDDITALAAETFGMPIALITLVDEHRQWFKSRVGLEATETPREESFCAHALGLDSVLVVPDATLDERVASYHCVTGEAHIRFYAGAPLRTTAGETLGTLCVADRVPRTLEPQQVRVLEALGRQVMMRLELKRKMRELESTQAALAGMMQDQQKTAEALRESEERLSIAMDGDGLGVWDWNLKTDDVYYSERWCSMLGYEVTEIAARLDEWAKRVHPEDLPRALHLMQVHLEGKSEAYVCEQRMRTKEGDWRWIRASGKIIARDEAGRPARVVGTHLDISERKESERNLRQSEALLRIAGQAAKLGGWYVTVPEFELTWSEETAALHDEAPGFSPAIGASTLYYLPPFRQMIREAFEACARDGTAFSLEAQILTAKGRKVWVRSIGEAVRDSKGVIVRVQGAMQDISALKAAEQSLVESQRRFRLLADAMPFVVWTAQPDGVVDFCNRQFYDYTGASVEDPVMTIWQPRLHPEDLEPAMEVWMECIREEKPFSTEYRVLGRDGAYRWFRVQALPVWDASGRLVKWYGAGIDIHEHKRLELEARQLADRLTRTLESITDAFLTLDGDWCFNYVNVEMERLLGHSREGMLGRNLWEMFPSTVGSRFEQEYRRAVEQQVTVGFEDHSPLLDKWLEVRAYPCEEGLAVYLRDITERKRQEQHLHVLSDLGQRLNVTHAPAEAAEIITEVAEGLFGWDAATLDLYTPERDLIRPVLTVQCVNGVKTHVPPSHPGERPTELERQMLEEGAELLLHTFTDEEGEPPAEGVEKGMASQMFAPIRDGKRSIGLLSLQSHKANAYNQADLHLLQLLADYCGGALQRIHTESERRTSEERFRLLSKATNDAIWDWDLITDSLWWNDGLETLFGQITMKQQSDIDSWIKRIHPGDRDAVVEGLRQAIAGDAAMWAAEYRYMCKDGTHAYVLDRGHIIRDEQGKGVRMIGGITDLTERKRTEETLRQQAALLDKAQEAILVRDMSHQILYWNKSAERVYGWPAEEACGRDVGQLLYRDHADFLQATAKTLQDGEWSGEIEQTTRDGRAIIVEGHWSLVRDEQGQPKQILAINKDITERKKIEQQHLRSQRMESIGTLAGGIAHDLNNVLAPILMSIDLLKLNEKDARRLTMLSTIEGSAKRGADMVRQVLSFARGVEGQQIEVQVAHIVNDIEKITNETFLKNIEVRNSTPRGGLWVVKGDPTQLHQVLLNLCVNARDAMPEGGVLTLSAENVMLDENYASMNKEAKAGPHVRLQVQDTGTGMPPDVVERIFEPFYTTKDIGKGSGLGLSTSLAIIKSHGGFVRVQSEPGKGTLFDVHLPAQPGGGTEESPVEQSELPHGNGEMVLLVDDEAPVREITSQTLETFGYRVLVACDGVEATAVYAANQEAIDIVLTDMMMPLMDGPAMIKVLKHINPQLRVIGASGLNLNTMVAKAISAGVNHFIPKPYTAETLLKTLRKVLTGAG